MRRKASKRKQGEQSERFIKAAREAGASEDEREFDETLKRIAQTHQVAKAKKRK